jgi:DNA polymerase I
MIVLIDTYSAFFRAHYALPPMSTRAGEPTAALYGFSALLLKLLREQPGAALAFALDAPRRTFRKAAYEGYKAGRASPPDALLAQLRRLPALLAAFGVPAIAAPGFEADDVLATLARRTRELSAGPTLIVSGDRDLLQVAGGEVKVHFIGRRGESAVTYDEAAVVARFGVPPSRLPSYTALIGDASDNLPGVPGIGPSTARRLLTEFESTRALLSMPDRVSPERVRRLLLDHEEQILLTEQLATLRADVELPPGEHSWQVVSRDSLGRLREQFEELEFKSLLGRIDKLSLRGGP